MNPNNHKRPLMDISSVKSMRRPQLAPDQAPKRKEPKSRVGLKKARELLRSKILLVLGVVVLAGLPSAYFYQKSQQAERRLNDPNTASKEVIDEVVRKAGHHILLPTGEQPTLATVSDVSKVKGQPFFQNAENGDKVLVFTQARKAYLYRPGKDLIIEVAPLNVDSLQNAATGTTR